jgi:hypothetical protein
LPFRVIRVRITSGFYRWTNLEGYVAGCGSYKKETSCIIATVR